MSSIKTSQRQTRSSKDKAFVELPLSTTKRKSKSKKEIADISNISSILSSLTISEEDEKASSAASASDSASYASLSSSASSYASNASIIPFTLKKNNDYVFSYGFEWEPGALHYRSHKNDNDYDRKIIYEFNDKVDENIKTIVTIEKLGKLNCTTMVPCLYNLEIATGVFTYREWDDIEFLKMKEHMTIFKRIWDEMIQKDEDEKYIIYVPNKTQFYKVNLYKDCGLTDLIPPENKEILCGYTPDINSKTLSTLHGIPQLTTSIPYHRVFDFMSSIQFYEDEDWIEKPGLFGTPVKERVKVIKDRNSISSFSAFFALNIDQIEKKKKMGIECYSFLYVLHNYCYIESAYDRETTKAGYLKSLFTFKPRSNLGVSYQYLREKDPTMEKVLNDFYDEIHLSLFSKIKESLKKELLHDFSLLNDEEELMYFRIKFLAYREDKIDAYKELKKEKDKKLNYEQYCYFFRKYFNPKFPVGSKETLKLQIDYIADHKDTYIGPNTDIVDISMLYMLRQLIFPEYFRVVTRVDEFNRDKIDSESPILDGYLYDIPPEQLDEYIREGYIKRCTVNIPFCHTHDAPKLTKESKGKGRDKKLVADYRLEIFEWVPQNSNFIFEIRDIQTFDKKCKKINCLDELIEHVLTKVIKFANPSQEFSLAELEID